MRTLLYLLWLPRTQRIIRAIVAIGALLCLLLMLVAMAFNLREQVSETWLWLAPAGLVVGPALSIALRWSRVRRWSSGLRRALAAGAFSGAAGLSLWAARPDVVVGILGTLIGIGWGIWQVEQWRLRDAGKELEKEKRLAQERHDELLREIRRSRAPHRRLAGHPRCARSRPRSSLSA